MNAMCGIYLLGFSGSCIDNVISNNTAYENGFLSLNPLAHIDIIGFSFILLFIFLLGSILSGHFPPTYRHIQ